jgi:phosphate acetyltransferase
MELMNNLWDRAKEDKRTIVLPEGNEDRTLIAAAKVLKEDLASLIIIGNEISIKDRASFLQVDLSGAMIVDPVTSDKKTLYAEKVFELRKDKGMTFEQATEFVKDNVHFGIMMVKLGEADGLVSGAIHTTGDLLRPAFQIIKAAPGVPIVSSFFIMMVPNCEYGDDGLLLFADCGVNPNPSAEELATIALQTARTAEHLCGMEPRVALLSFSTKGSAEHELVSKVKKAYELAKEADPSLIIDGELQLDAAIVPSVSLQKSPNSSVAGRANVLVFPDLQSGNIGYKLVERFAKAQAIGPICQGFDKPINDLSRGCTADDIVQAIVVTVVQSQMGI